MATEDTAESTAPARQRRGVTQAQWDANRKVVKAEAAKVVKANATKAERAKKKALAKEPSQPGVADFQKRAKDIEARINSKSKK